MSFIQSLATVYYVRQRSGNNNNNRHHNATSPAFVGVLAEEHHRIALKHKLEDYAASTFDDDFDHVHNDEDNGHGVVFADLVSFRMRRDEANAPQSLDGQESLGLGQLNPKVTDSQLVSYASSTQSELTRTPSFLQFFVRMMPEGYNLVIKAYANDTVLKIHEKIESVTGIPVIEQRLTYRGKAASVGTVSG